ncbi:hypothetical protein AC249_AIPGENE8959 [Exaiptasia diaphana]|nr:hypothetical protein AC249_AIPGENE8959 [Exaiptasia diaphana]
MAESAVEGSFHLKYKDNFGPAFLNAKVKLAGYEEHFAEKVAEVDNKYSMRMHGLMTDNTDLRHHYMKKCEEVLRLYSKEETKQTMLELASEHKISVLALTEFRRTSKDSRTIETKNGTKWDIFWSGCERKRIHGVAIAVKHDPKQRIMQVCQISPRIMWIDLQYVGVDIRIFCLYAPTNCPTLPREMKPNDQTFGEPCKMK